MIQSETLELLEWSRLCQHLSTFAATKLGSVAARNLQIPTSQLQSEELLAQTKEVYDLETRLTTGLSFDGIQDIGDSLERAQLQGILAGNELLEIATTLFGARQLRRFIDNQPFIPVLQQLVSQLRTYPELEQEIHRCIDERGRVTDRSSPILGDLRTQIKQLRTQLNRSLQNILQRHSNAVQEQIITQRGDRFVIPVKAPQKDAIPGIVHDTSTSGATLYVEPSGVVPLGNQLRQLVRKEQVEEEAIRRTLTKLVAEVSTDLERLLAIATIIDLATARARYSFWLKANPPRFINRNDGESINLRALRHPLLVWQQQHEQDRNVVPVDLFIQPNIRVVTITGPNTGGKTVTLKTLGLAALMAKVGLFIPAREPVEMPWFEQVLTDIGDEQSLEQSLSTFSGHIRRISRILTAIDESSFSLVLLDEVGAGTDPVEGSALAIALLQYLANNAQLSIATTHFGELKALKYEDDRFENASVEFDEISLSPTYRLLWGIPGRSNALTIAERLGLKLEVIEEAKNHLGGANDDVNQVIAGLEAQRKRQETKAAEAQKLVEQAERFYQEVSAKAAALQARERDLRASQDVAVQNAISEAKGEIAQVIRRLQKGTVTATDAQQATNELNQIAANYIAPPSKPKAGFKPQLGDRIRIPKLGQTAEVLSIPSDEGDLIVRFGIMKMTVNLEDIESLDGEKPVVAKNKKPEPIEEKPVETTPVPVIRTSKNTVDLRGSRVADAERTLDDAISTATGQLWIIHGHGTGKLRQGVREFLRQHPLISRYEDAQKADGGTGVTVAYLA